MKASLQSLSENWETKHSVWMRTVLSACLVALAAICPARAQQGDSIAEIARQARAQKADQPRPEPGKAQQVADQLAEDQDDAGNAPAGFKTYNAGDYRVWVPAPYTVEGHDDGGIVLANSQKGRAQALVLVGNPVVLPAADGDEAFHDMATKIARIYAQSSTCTQSTVAGRKAYQCGLAGASLLGRRVSGSAVFVRGSLNIVPVFCVAPTESRARDTFNNAHSNYQQKQWARDVMDQEDEDVRKAWQACEPVLQSVHLKEDGGAAPAGKAQLAASASAKPGSGAQTAAGSTNKPGPSASQADAGNAGGPPSLAEVAQQLHGGSAPVEATTQAPPDNTADTDIPDGFKTYTFNYCNDKSQQCWDAQIFIPVDAKLLSSGCTQYVFETKVKGQPFLLLAGETGVAACKDHPGSEPDPVRWHQLVDPESARSPGSANTISSLQMTLADQPAVITKLRFRKGTSDWMAKRADVETDGVQLVIGCMAPRDHFADGDELCTTVIESFRLP
jgi:hypothetical protein